MYVGVDGAADQRQYVSTCICMYMYMHLTHTLKVSRRPAEFVREKPLPDILKSQGHSACSKLSH